MNEICFDGKIERLRSPERVARLDVERVVDLCLTTGGITSVLDVGTISGLFVEAYAKRGLNVAGIDANPDMIDVARQFFQLEIFVLQKPNNYLEASKLSAR